MEQTEMKYPVGIQSFEFIRQKGFSYVDKTEYIYRLRKAGKIYFLSRPRRFGKSLLLNTMKAYYEGRRELFEGLAIDNLETEWTAHPVFLLDFNGSDYTSTAGVTDILDQALGFWEKDYGIEPKKDVQPSLRFENVVKKAKEATGQKVVVLIDEYDKPLLETIDNTEMQTLHKGTLKPFYEKLKSLDDYLEFVFLTGVTKFAKLSIFSGANSPNDISLLPDYNGICGVTESELHKYYQHSVRQMATETGKSYEETAAQLKELYDGYHFSEKKTEGVYNPFSLMNAFFSMRLGRYWFQTGTPSFLVKLLQKEDYDLTYLQNADIESDILTSVENMTENPIPVIYQSGYLTIKDYDEDFRSYRLGFPNREVEEGFIKYLLPFYTIRNNSESFDFVKNFVLDLRKGEPEQFMERLQTFYCHSDYRIAGKMEKYFQNSLYIIFRLMGFYTEVERAFNKGRADIVVKTPHFIYVIEVKLDGTAKEALQQIEHKGYAAPFAMDSRKIYKIGVSFSSKTRGIEEWIVE